MKVRELMALMDPLSVHAGTSLQYGVPAVLENFLEKICGGVCIWCYFAGVD